MRILTTILTVLFATLTLSATTVLAEETIYRWVDKDGVVHFGNRPEGNEDAEIVDIKATPDLESQENPEASSIYNTSSEPTRAQKLREERAQGRKEAAAQQQEMDVLCKNNRERVAALEPATRVMYTQEDGSVIRMDDNDRLRMLAESKEFIAENCDK